jgi:hypothetical protein
MNQIKSVGIELEGGYCYLCVQPVINEYFDLLHIDMGHDNSVHVKFVCKKHPHDPIMYNGEIKAWTNVKHMNQLFNFIQKLWRTKAFRQNKTCGNHLHVKFKDKEKWKVFDFEEKWTEFINRYIASFKSDKFLRRLHSSYCDSIWIKDPVWRRKGERYRMINFVSLAEPHHTLEFRILPHFKSAIEAQRSCQMMLNIIDDMATEGLNHDS